MMDNNEDELIAKFMNEPTTFIHDTGAYVVERKMSHNYHDWNKLMPVVEKIYRLEDDVKRLGVSVTIRNSKCIITIGKKRFACYTISPLNSTYHAVVAFIKWYNSQTP